MKIAINATFLSDKPTGVGVYAGELSRTLCRLKEDVIVFSPVPLPALPPDSVYRVPGMLRGSPRILNSLSRLLYINTVLPLLCRIKGVDVLYCPITEFPLVPLVPQVVHVHDLHPLHYPEQFGLAASRLSLSMKVIGRAARRIAVSSHFVRKEVLLMTGIEQERVDVVPLSYDSEVFRPRSPEMKQDFLMRYSLDRPYILFVGSLFPYKNAGTLIEAFLSIRDQLPHVLVIAGRREFAQEALPGDSRIVYLDYVPWQDLPYLYSYADVFVYPSLREGFGLAPLEAMACGAPVIGSQGGSLPEVIGGAALLFDPMDARELSRLLLNILGDEGLRKDMIQKGLRHVQGFSPERTARGIVQSCKRALER